MTLVNWLDQNFYPEIANKNWDDLTFPERAKAHITPESIVLDASAGADLVEAMHFRSPAGHICSVHLDPQVEGNENFNEVKLADAGKIPYDVSMFDVVLQITP